MATPWNKGKSMSDEFKMKISARMKVVAVELNTGARLAAFNKGKKYTLGRIQSEDEKKKRSDSCKAAGCGKWMLGRSISIATRKKLSVSNSGENNASWRGGVKKTKDGYFYIHSPNHPHCTSQGYVLQHRLVMEKHIGRFLNPTEIVHHINHIRSDNRIENLMLFQNHSEHRDFHLKEREKEVGAA